MQSPLHTHPTSSYSIARINNSWARERSAGCLWQSRYVFLDTEMGKRNIDLTSFFRVHGRGGVFMEHANADPYCTVQSIINPSTVKYLKYFRPPHPTTLSTHPFTQLDDDAKEERVLELKRKRMLRRRIEGQGDDEESAGNHAQMEEEGEAADGGASDKFLDPKLSRKILLQASKQMAEEERSSHQRGGAAEAGKGVVRFASSGRCGKTQARRHGDSMDSDDDEDGEDAYRTLGWDVEEMDKYDHEEEEEDGMVEFKEGAVHMGAGGLSEAEQRVVSSFMDIGAGERRTLADIIMDKIRERAEEDDLEVKGLPGQEGEDGGRSKISLKVREVYAEIGKLLKTYTAGKLPKAFKILPALANWEEVVYLTRPDEWTPHATFAATRIFASNLNAKLSQRFFNLILLEKCRDDICANKNLNYHYYTGAYYKGMGKSNRSIRGIRTSFELCIMRCVEPTFFSLRLLSLRIKN